MIRTYQEITSLPTFLERYKYAKTSQRVGEDTFGFDRWLNQLFYSSPEWKELRRYVILRDESCDLAHPDFPIEGRVYVHHLNPISKKDILERSEFALNPDFFICTSFNTHQAIHYGDESLLLINWFEERRPNDTCPWKE